MSLSIEKSLVKSWKDLLELEGSTLAFGDAILAKDIGELKAGTLVDSIWFRWEDGIIQIYLKPTDTEETSLKFELRLEVGNKL